MTTDVPEESVVKVTTEKIKNPGRQEWGRKLGKMQRELKLKKLQESSTEHPPQEITKKTHFLTWEYLLTALGISIGLGALYYQKKSYDAQVKPVELRRPIATESTARFSDF